jgi:virginiamycin B lyase
MLLRIGVYLCLVVWASSAAPAQPVGKAESGPKPAKGAKTSVQIPRAGIKTPGVQIPFANLKSEAEFAVVPQWIAFTDAPLLADDHGLYKIDAKKNELGKPVATLNKPCGGIVNAFTSLWIPACADHALLRIDPKTWKTTATVSSGTGTAKPALAATADSIWLLSDDKTSLSRIDPEQNAVVAEIRLPAGCNTVTFGETALWVTCPAEDRVLRIDPDKNLVDKRIEVSAQPKALAIGEGSIWVLCQKDGKVERIDPKTNKVIKTIELAVPGAEGTIAVNPGSIWVSQAGFPLTRIDPATDKVVQQFWGAGGGSMHFGVNSVWLGNLPDGKVWRVDPKRVIATLAE